MGPQVGDDGTQICPHCGFKNESGGPVCGNCGKQLEGHEYPTSLADHGTGRVKFAVVAAIFVALGALIWTQGSKGVDALNDLIDSEAGSFDPDELPDFGGGSGNADNNDGVRSPYNGVKELVAALKKGGLDCTQVKVDHADDTIATGSCQAPGEVARVHVQINIYFYRPALESATGIFEDRAFTYVHDANWFVVTQLPTAKRVHDILGGKLVRAK